MHCSFTTTERSVEVPVILFSKVYRFCGTGRNVSISDISYTSYS